MKKIFVILKKELIDTLRDRRTIMMMVVLPVLLIFVIVNLTITLGRSQTRKAQEKELNVGLIAKGNAEAFQPILLKQKNITLKENEKSVLL